jgi:hypothetical protein
MSCIIAAAQLFSSSLELDWQFFIYMPIEHSQFQGPRVA